MHITNAYTHESEHYFCKNVIQINIHMLISSKDVHSHFLSKDHPYLEHMLLCIGVLKLMMSFYKWL